MAKKTINNYGVEQIKTLEGIEAIRLRPGMYIGSVGPEGVKHITLEIISNVIDEYLNGHCTECSVEVGKLDKGECITISDNGRGVPFGKAEDGSETLVNVYTKLHTGAKFDSDGKTGYNTSGGMNGVGAKATNALSETFTVSSIRNGQHAIACFKKGELVSYAEQSWHNPDEHGTSVQFRPDKEIFKEGIKLDYTSLKNQLKELSYLSPGLIIKFKYEDKAIETITSVNGIKDYIQEINKDKIAITSMFYAETQEDRINVKIAMLYNDNYSDSYKLYTNSIPNSGGTHLTGFRTALTQTINEYCRESKILKEKDENLSGDDLKEGLSFVLALNMPDPVFSGQTKDVLTSSEARTIVQRLMIQELKQWFKTNPKEVKIIAEKALSARRAREAAKKARDNARNAAASKTKNKFMNLPSKLVDAWSKKRLDCELFIAEGDSAAGGLVAARNGETQAVFPIRGKIISARKQAAEKIYANQEVSNIVKALGLEVNPKTGKLIYDKTKLRYGKIVFAADADPDGQSIKNLLITCFWWLCPDLFTNGHIYVAVPPLFRITTRKNEYIYLRDAVALEEYKTMHKNEKFLINRAKG